MYTLRIRISPLCNSNCRRSNSNSNVSWVKTKKRRNVFPGRKKIVFDFAISHSLLWWLEAKRPKCTIVFGFEFWIKRFGTQLGNQKQMILRWWGLRSLLRRRGQQAWQDWKNMTKSTLIRGKNPESKGDPPYKYARATFFCPSPFQLIVCQVTLENWYVGYALDYSKLKKPSFCKQGIFCWMRERCKERKRPPSIVKCIVMLSLYSLRRRRKKPTKSLLSLLLSEGLAPPRVSFQRQSQ